MHTDSSDDEVVENPWLLLNVLLYSALLFIFLANNTITPCMADPYRVISLSTTTFLLIHVLLPLLGSVKIDVGEISFSSSVIVNALRIPLKKNVIIVLFVFSAILWGVFFFVPISSFRVSSTPPIINGFDVTGVESGITKTFPPGSRIDPGSDGILVKANINGGNEDSCKWFAITGKIIPGKCQVHYTSITGGVDVLTLTVQSTCETLETSSTLCINRICLKPTSKP